MKPIFSIFLMMISFLAAGQNFGGNKAYQDERQANEFLKQGKPHKAVECLNQALKHLPVMQKEERARIQKRIAALNRNSSLVQKQPKPTEQTESTGQEDANTEVQPWITELPAVPEQPEVREKIVTISLGNSTYVGEVRNGKPNGHGTINFNNGDQLIANFRNGEVEGDARYNAPGEYEYVGGYKGQYNLKLVRSGYGIARAYSQLHDIDFLTTRCCRNCKRYEGYWENDKKYGSGKCFDKINGGNLIYDGNFRDDCPTQNYPR